MSVAVHVETGKRRTFAGAIEWPGWCRSARTEGEAIEALSAYAPRYAAALGAAARGFPRRAPSFEVVERIRGDATTDFGAPGKAPSADARPVRGAELKRLETLLRACWDAFDTAAGAAKGASLRKGPRGGGRDVPKIVAHVLEADGAYLYRLGGRRDMPAARIRAAIVEALAARARGEQPGPSRRTAPLWTPRYAVRRSAWHALDHAWEIEDRS